MVGKGYTCLLFALTFLPGRAFADDAKLRDTIDRSL
jgi:hypothetical protein